MRNVETAEVNNEGPLSRIPASFVLSVVGIFVLLGIGAYLALSSFNESRPQDLPEAEMLVQREAGPDIRLIVEVASTPEQTSKGMMYRKTLDDGTGMLFAFAKDDILRFWMKDTFVPLDLAFLDRHGRILEIIPDLEPQSTAIVTSSMPARYALEVGGGEFARRGIKVGDVVTETPS